MRLLAELVSVPVVKTADPETDTGVFRVTPPPVLFISRLLKSVETEPPIFCNVLPSNLTLVVAPCKKTPLLI